MPGKIISLVNFKGGVGKTTLTVNLAACLAKEYDKKVLIVDLDPQSNSSIWLLGPARWSLLNSEEDIMKTSAAMFYKTWSADMFIRPFIEPAGNFLPQLYLSPASLKMLKLEPTILKFCLMRRLDGTYKEGDEYFFFANTARSLREVFGVVLIDCPPNLYFGTCNALCHSDYILIPCIPDTLSTSGLKQMIEEMERTLAPLVKSKRLKRTPIIMGIAITKFKAATNEHKSGLENMESIMSEFHNGEYLMVDNKTLVFRDQPIGEFVVHAEAVQDALPLCFYSPNARAYREIREFSQAVLRAVESRE
jgi:chromosome partitioning protein